jgi:hypothetical protein
LQRGLQTDGPKLHIALDVGSVSTSRWVVPFIRYDIFRQVALDGDNEAKREETRQWTIGWDRITKDAPESRRVLEKEMRKLLEPTRHV